MKRVLITGATSMLGVALAEECVKNGVRVIAVVRKNSEKLCRLPKSDLIELADAELENLDKLGDREDLKCDVFYHFAWANTGAARNNDLAAQAENIRYTLLAVTAAKKLGCKMFVGAGSQAEYGYSETLPIGENSAVNPVQPYGIVKYAAGKLAAIHAERLGLDFQWTRIFSVYGINDKATTMVSYALSTMLSGQATAFSDGENYWDYLFSEDAGRAFYLIGEKAHGSNIYCIGSGIAKPLREYIEIMSKLTGSRALQGIGKKQSLNKPLNLQADISALTRDTGFVPRYSFEEGIAKTIEWMRRS